MNKGQDNDALDSNSLISTNQIRYLQDLNSYQARIYVHVIKRQ
jgi:hypothetical protein